MQRIRQRRLRLHRLLRARSSASTPAASALAAASTALAATLATSPSCSNMCGPSTCEQLVISFGLTCGALEMLQCDCGGCCPLTAPPPSSPPCGARSADNAFVDVVGANEEARADEEPLLLDSLFAPTFFNMTCLREGGTGSACDAHVAEAYSDEM